MIRDVATRPKAEVRQIALERRRILTNREEKEHTICTRLLHAPFLAAVQTVMLYAAIGEEVDVWPWAQELGRRGVRLAFPVCDVRAKSLTPKIASDLAQLRVGTFGVREPAGDAVALRPDELDAVIVPGLLFDRSGYRIGYGGGYYDRFLLRLRPDVVCVGVVFSDLLCERVPRAPYDIPVHWIVTDKDVLRA